MRERGPKPKPTPKYQKCVSKFEEKARKSMNAWQREIGAPIYVTNTADETTRVSKAYRKPLSLTRERFRTWAALE